MPAHFPQVQPLGTSSQLLLQHCLASQPKVLRNQVKKLPVAPGSKAPGQRPKTLLQLAIRLARSELIHVLRLAWLLRASIKTVLQRILRPIYTHPWLSALAAWATAEGLFAWWWQRRYQRYTRSNHDAEDRDGVLSDGIQAFGKVLTFIQGFTGRPALATKLREYICAWFKGADWDQLKLGNIEDHIAYSFFYKSPEAVRASGHGPLLDSMLEQLLSSCDLSDVQPGHNDQVKAMWHLNEPLRVRYLPLTFYMVMEALAGINSCMMRLAGFKRGKADGCGYWYYGVKQPATTKTSTTNTHTTTSTNAVTTNNKPTATRAETLTGTQGTPVASAVQLGKDSGKTSSKGPAALDGPTQPLQATPTQPQAPATAVTAHASSINNTRAPPRADPRMRPVKSSLFGPEQAWSAGLRGASAGGHSGLQGTACAGHHMGVDGGLCGSEEGDERSRLVRQRTLGGVGGSRSCPTFQDLIECAEQAVQAAQQADATHMQALQREQSLAHTGGPKQRTPLVFLHGVGAGLLPYTLIWRRLLGAASAHDTPLVVMEFKHVSMRLCRRVPTADTAATSVVAALSQLGLTQGCVIAHSYGTFVASRLVQMFPHRVKGLVLVDPVCFGMFLPRLLFNFVYNTDIRTDSVWHWVKDHAMKFFARDLHCAATFCRRFFWHQIQLDPTQLPAHSLVVVGGQDELLHGDEVAQAIAAVAAARAGTLPAAAPDSSRQPSQPTATRADSTPAETDASLGDGASSVQTASHTSNTEQPAAVAAAAAAAADCPLSPLLLTANLVPPLSAYTKLAAEDSTHDTSGRDMQTEGDDSEAVQGQRQGSSVQGSAAVVCVGGRRAGGVCTGPGTKMVYDPDMAHADFMFKPRTCSRILDQIISFADTLDVCDCAQCQPGSGMGATLSV